MDNNARSERSRTAIIQAALDVIARDGPGRLTLDAIARESGISKGGLMHQFRTKEAVLRALLEHQHAQFEAIGRRFAAEQDSGAAEPELLKEIAIAREVIAQPRSAALALLGALALSPELMGEFRNTDVATMDRIRAEADDLDQAMLRWAATRGLAFSVLLGLCPITDAEQERLFALLLDKDAWPQTRSGEGPAVAPTVSPAAKRRRRGQGEAPAAGRASGTSRRT